MYDPLKPSCYIQLPQELRNSAKGLINLKNNDNECFIWCHIRDLNVQDKDQQRIKKSEKRMVEQLNYQGIELPVAAKQHNKIEKRNYISINVFGYENKQFYPIYLSKETNQDVLNLLLKEKNEHYILIKDFNKLIFDQTKHKCKKTFLYALPPMCQFRRCFNEA